MGEGISVPGPRPAADPAAPLAVQPRHRRDARRAAIGQHHRVRHDQRRLRRPRYRYTYAATGKPGWFLFDGLVKHDLHTGAEERFAFEDGVYGSETAMAPRVGSTGEDDGYLVTLTTDMNDDASYCLVFDAARVADGPVCKLACRNGSPAAPTRRGRPARSCGAGATPTPRRPRSGCRWSSRSPTPSPECSGLLGDEWTLLVIQQALMGATRYAEFKARLPISNSVLSSRLAVAGA